MLHYKRNRLSVCVRDDAGGSLVECAFACSILLLIVFSIFDFAFMCYAKATMQNAVRTAARYAITGNCSNPTSGCFSGTNQQNRLDTIVNLVTSYSWAFTPTVTVTCVQGTCATAYGSGSNNAGGPGDLVQVSASYVYSPVMLSHIPGTPPTYTFHVSSTFRNELFPPPGS